MHQLFPSSQSILLSEVVNYRGLTLYFQRSYFVIASALVEVRQPWPNIQSVNNWSTFFQFVNPVGLTAVLDCALQWALCFLNSCSVLRSSFRAQYRVEDVAHDASKVKATIKVIRFIIVIPFRYSPNYNYYHSKHKD